ncbi:hypothetical protein K227x_13260 [Rubripirellula lacrimiformis]|uniref:Uncharacterized protein n=1 Tax=Rubripirellula lacrimiformis TaxID=1930273 RepID=A0A517N726_9BACT|nr:hypothetical protein [Rubripirellula lacrimiformis]QDT02947.1 hypothetical protein K227x_13260 [Rubripirellula lacrimiformis]
MQLDQTHVVIRLRTLSEIGDLALVMIRRYPAALLVGFVLGALPWAILNAAILSWIPIVESGYGLDDEEAMSEIIRYLAWMALLVVAQTPAAGVLTTVYLGQAVFEKRPTWSAVFAEAKRQFGRWFWTLGVVRMAVPAMVVCLIRWGQPASAFWDVLVPVSLLIWIAVVRSSRPFLPEILLLEQCPIRSPDELVITARRRSTSLHGPMGGDLSGRFIAVSLVLGVLLLSVLYSLMWARGISIGNWAFLDLWVLLLIYPVALWTVAGISVLVRLLNYLDTRIRLEGWEVELAVRAEAIRQFGDPVDAPVVEVTQ